VAGAVHTLPALLCLCEHSFHHRSTFLVQAESCGRDSLDDNSTAVQVIADNLATGGTRVMLCDFDLCHRLSDTASAAPPGGPAAGSSEGPPAGATTGSRHDEQGGRPFFWGTLDSVAPEVIANGVSGYGTPSDWW
jgi:serine/threonine protein kinase